MTDRIHTLRKEILEGNAPVPFPKGEYSVILVDPPWHYELRDGDATHRNRVGYPTMMPEDILELPVETIAAKQSYLFLWVTTQHIELGLQCMRRWGFEYKTTHTWVKTNNVGDRIRFGVGHWGRNCTEFILIGAKGQPPAFSTLGIRDVATAFFAPRGEHSSKPDFPMLVRLNEVLRFDPKIELFARRERDGWDTWGLEAPKSDMPL